MRAALIERSISTGPATKYGELILILTRLLIAQTTKKRTSGDNWTNIDYTMCKNETKKKEKGRLVIRLYSYVSTILIARAFIKLQQISAKATAYNSQCWFRPEISVSAKRRRRTTDCRMQIGGKVQSDVKTQTDDCSHVIFIIEC